MQEIFVRLSVAAAIFAVICRFIPEQKAVAIAVTRHLHIALPLRLLYPTLLLILAGALSAIALASAVYRMTAPLRM